MYAVEFYVFALLVLTAAFLSVTVKDVLYAAFCHVQAAVAVAGILAGLNAKFVSFAVLAMSAASVLVFLTFALIVFDLGGAKASAPASSMKVLPFFFVLSGVETAWLLFKPRWGAGRASNDFSLPVLGDILYADYGVCVIMFAALILSCMAGLSALLIEKSKSEGGAK